MAVLERTIVTAIKRMLVTRGCWAVKTHGSAFARGNPDLFACCRGRFIGFEVKRDPGEAPTPLQQAVLNEIIAAGGVGACVHSVEEADRVLSEAAL